MKVHERLTNLVWMVMTMIARDAGTDGEVRRGKCDDGVLVACKICESERPYHLKVIDTQCRLTVIQHISTQSNIV